MHPSQSFGFKVASYCSLAETVTARTDTTTILRATIGSQVTRIFRGVGPTGQERHKGEGDKVIFVTQGGSPEAPVDPRITYVT